MFNYHEVFEEHGKSPATPQEWENCNTTHDYIWMFNVTADFTGAMMMSYLNDHRDAKIVEKEMDQFTEELQRQTGLSIEDTAMYAKLGQYIYQDRKFVDDPEGARQQAYKQYESHKEVHEILESVDSVEDLEMPEELIKMAEDFNNMLEERSDKNNKMELELAAIEAEMSANELSGVFSSLEELLKKINEDEGDK